MLVLLFFVCLFAAWIAARTLDFQFSFRTAFLAVTNARQPQKGGPAPGVKLAGVLGGGGVKKAPFSVYVVFEWPQTEKVKV